MYYRSFYHLLYSVWYNAMVLCGRREKWEDEVYYRRKYFAAIGKPLNLQNPVTFNEKIQWLKLNDRNPQYTMMVDKYLVKNYISEIIGQKYVVPLLGVWNSPEEIDFSMLPEQFVLKCNHNSQKGIVICKDNAKLDMKRARADLRKAMGQDYYLSGGHEWPYKNVPRKIIAEKYISNDNNTELMDYKLMCFNGKCKCCFVCTDRYIAKAGGLKVTFFDRDWNQMPFERHYPASKVPIPRPSQYEEMIHLAEMLSENIPFVRVDFYVANQEIYFGELTFYPGSGFEEFNPDEWDTILGSWLVLPDPYGAVNL